LARTPFRVHTIAAVLEHVRTHGGDADGLIRAARLPAAAATAPWVELRLDRLAAFFELAAAAVRDPLLGIHVGIGLSRATWDVLQLSCLSAPTLADALGQLPRLVPLFNTAVELTVRDSGGELVVEHRVPGHPEGLSRHGNELWVAAVLERARSATGAPLRPRAAWFAHAMPGDLAGAVAQALAIDPPRFGAGVTGLAIRAADAARPLRTGDPVLTRVLDRLVEPILAALAGRRDLAAEVCRRIDAAFDEGVPALDDIARGLGRSGRTLQRELAELDTTFRALVDHVRRVKARTLLAQDLPVDEVAARLGYSERSAFVRAFGRWTGAVPHDWRVR
jgi:AraC-like DNA-binding protein